MQATRDALLPVNLPVAQLFALEADLDCAILGDGESRDQAQEKVVGWINHMTGPTDVTGDQMWDLVYGLYGQVMIALNQRDGGPAPDADPSNWCAQGLAWLDDDDEVENDPGTTRLH